MTSKVVLAAFIAITLAKSGLNLIGYEVRWHSTQVEGGQ